MSRLETHFFSPLNKKGRSRGVITIWLQSVRCHYSLLGTFEFLKEMQIGVVWRLRVSQWKQKKVLLHEHVRTFRVGALFSHR